MWFGGSRAFARPMRFASVRRFTAPAAGAPWSLGVLNHVAIAVPDLAKASAFYRDTLRATVSEAVPLPDHGVYTVFVDLGNTKIELLHPLGEKSPIAKFLERNPGGGMHHVCIEVSDITAAQRALAARNVEIEQA